MKKLIVLTMAAMILCACTIQAAAVDLSGLSFAELAELRDQCQAEMMARNEWQEVVVPQGVWEVGKHIPAGEWVVRSDTTSTDSLWSYMAVIEWGVGRPANSDGFSYTQRKGEVKLGNRLSKSYKSLGDNLPDEYRITLKDGDFVFVDPGYNAVVFMPAESTPPFTFK